MENILKPDDIDFTTVTQVYFVTKHGTLKKRNALFPAPPDISKQSRDVQRKGSNNQPKPLIQVVIPRSRDRINESQEDLMSINHKKTQFGKHNSFNLRLWT